MDKNPWHGIKKHHLAFACKAQITRRLSEFWNWTTGTCQRTPAANLIETRGEESQDSVMSHRYLLSWADWCRWLQAYSCFACCSIYGNQRSPFATRLSEWSIFRKPRNPSSRVSLTELNRTSPRPNSKHWKIFRSGLQEDVLFLQTLEDAWRMKWGRMDNRKIRGAEITGSEKSGIHGTNWVVGKTQLSFPTLPGINYVVGPLLLVQY